MSLIDEALKRARDQAAGYEMRERTGERPWTPPMLPEQRKLAPWIRNLMVGAAAAALATAGVFLFSSRKSGGIVKGSSAPGAAPSAMTIGAANTSDLPAITSRVSVEPPPRGRSVPVEKPSGTRARSQTAPGRVASDKGRLPGPSPLREDPAANPRGHRRESGGPLPPAAPQSRRDVRTHIGELWVPGGAKIELEGIVYSELSPVALINGRILGPGAVIEGFTLLEVRTDRVKLEGSGTTLFIRLK